ncbi:MAG: zinc ribbon domain-containing protein [Candidatus Dormibacteraceae bacterium]
MNPPQTALRHQQLALRIGQLRSKSERLEQKIAGDSELAAIRAELTIARAERRRLELKVRQSEEDAASRRQRLKSRQSELMSGRVRQPSELIKLGREIEHQQATLNQVEDAELLLMSQAEELDNQLAKLEQRAEVVAARISSALPELQAERTLVDQEIVQLEGERGRLWSDLPADWQRQYQRIEQRISNPMAEVVGGQCQGCRVSITSNGLQKLRRGELVNCDNCSRLLIIS